MRWSGAVAVVVLAVTAVPAAAQTAVETGAGVSLREAAAALRVDDERREGYDRGKFKHWVDADGDGCDTRREVLLAEAAASPAVGARCALSGGRWYSAYDDVYVDGAGGLDIDHMVPLAEAWDSGAYAWDAALRQAYANDLDEEKALVAVTGRTNRSKADKDPAEWLPPYEAGRCTYVTDWVVVKTRYRLSADLAEHAVLTAWAERCPNIPVPQHSPVD